MVATCLSVLSCNTLDSENYLELYVVHIYERNDWLAHGGIAYNNNELIRSQ